jgi:hypothetical protein
LGIEQGADFAYGLEILSGEKGGPHEGHKHGHVHEFFQVAAQLSQTIERVGQILMAAARTDVKLTFLGG